MLRLIRREGLIEAYEDRPVGPMVRAGLRNELRVTSQSSDSGPRSMPALVTEPAFHL